MLVQAAALGLLVADNGAFSPSLAAAALLGAGTAMVFRRPDRRHRRRRQLAQGGDPHRRLLTGASGLLVATTSWQPLRILRPAAAP
jgi:hypothetical protein